MSRIVTVAAVSAAVAALALPAMTAAPAGATSSGPLSRGDTSTLLTIQDQRITESSGLTRSLRHPGVLYTHNDSGDQPRIYALDADGRTVAALTLRGAHARDWEAIATGRDAAGRPAVFVGDIGDNLHGAWPTISVYRVTEPATLRDTTVTATRFRFRYADGPRDAEALLIDPRTNRLYVASKESRAGLYEAPARLRTDRVNVLRRVASAPSTVTDGSFSPDGRRFVLRDYFVAHVFSAPGKELDSFGLPLQRQGESATYSADGRYLFVGSEGEHSRVVREKLPASVLAPGGSSKDATGSDPAGQSGQGGEAEPSDSIRRTVVAGAIAVLAAGLLIRLTRRRR